jgi:hypothetical protein
MEITSIFSIFRLPEQAACGNVRPLWGIQSDGEYHQTRNSPPLRLRPGTNWLFKNKAAMAARNEAKTS